ncbi:MAG: TrkH family potassium uptake protein [Oscillospiraceae bacterium]|nr:TrkH family potassium uptake protein [Oscillospiraceae bacterium]
MNFKGIARIVGIALLLEACFMLPGMLLSLWDGEPDVALAYLATEVIVLAVGGALFLWGRNARGAFYEQEGFVATSLSWIALSVLGCLPFVFSGQIPSYVDALFEMVSGFTTTGASILTDVEAMSRGLLLWRSASHWIGGMGILVFLLAVTPAGGGYTMHLLRAESPGPSVGKLTPRMGQTTKILYGMYIVLTIVNLLFLLAGGMPMFDAVCTALGTAGTGGFGIKADSMASYSPYIQNVTTVFMLIFGVNFTVYYMIVLRRFSAALMDEELRLYLGVFALSTAGIAWNIRSMYATLEETVRHAAFQVSTIMTTTGYATTDFDLWPSFSKGILLMLMLLGACAGSTGGGLKMARVLLLMKNLHRSVRRSLHPNTVRVVKVNGEPVSEWVLSNANAYVTAYCVMLMGSYLLVSLDGFSIEANISAVFSCFNNIGPGFAEVGPTLSFAGYSAFSKIILTLDMLFGRLEIFPMLVLFSRHTWKRSL